MNIGNKKIIYRKNVDGLFLYLFGKEEIFIAGKEFKGKDKKVAKMTRDGLIDENLRDGSIKDISHRSRGRPENKEEFVPERERKKAENEDSKSGKGKRLQMEKIRKSSARQEAVEDTVEVTLEEKVSGYRKKLHRHEKIPDDDNNLNSQKKSIRKKQLQKQMTREQAKAGRLSFDDEGNQMVKGAGMKPGGTAGKYIATQAVISGIYHIDENTIGKEHLFRDLDYVKEHGLEVDAANYKCVYSDRMLASDDLDGLYATFNDNPPADYKAHSMSVSDVVIMHQNGETKAFYVDRFGFEELPDFATQRENMLDITPEVENVDWENDITCISFYAAECAEFPVMGEVHYDLTLPEALEAYEKIPSERMHGLKCVGFDLKDGSDYGGWSGE